MPCVRASACPPLPLPIPSSSALRPSSASISQGIGGTSTCPSTSRARLSKSGSGPRFARYPAARRAAIGELAHAIGEPAAVRAVAQANGRNRVAILVPCHRVIGADGGLGGYGGGLWRKKRLLEIEGAL